MLNACGSVGMWVAWWSLSIILGETGINGVSRLSLEMLAAKAISSMLSGLHFSALFFAKFDATRHFLPATRGEIQITQFKLLLFAFLFLFFPLLLSNADILLAEEQMPSRLRW